MNREFKHIFFWTASILVTLFFSLLTFILFNEWWTVAIKKDVDNYPWGLVNENPWYYENPDTYSKVMLMEGVVMLVAVTLTIWFLSQRQKARVFYSLLACVGFFGLMIIKAQIR